MRVGELKKLLKNIDDDTLLFVEIPKGLKHEEGESDHFPLEEDVYVGHGTLRGLAFFHLDMDICEIEED